MLKITGKDLINYLKPNLANTLVKEMCTISNLSLEYSAKEFGEFFNAQSSTSNLRFFNAPKQLSALSDLCEIPDTLLLPQHILLYKLLQLVFENTSSDLDIEGSQGRALMRLMESTFSLDMPDLNGYTGLFLTGVITPLNIASIAFKALFLTKEEMRTFQEDVLEYQEAIDSIKTIIAYMLCALFLPLALKYKPDSFEAVLPYYFALGVTLSLSDLLDIVIKETKNWN